MFRHTRWSLLKIWLPPAVLGGLFAYIFYIRWGTPAVSIALLAVAMASVLLLTIPNFLVAYSVAMTNEGARATTFAGTRANFPWDRAILHEFTSGSPARRRRFIRMAMPHGTHVLVDDQMEGFDDPVHRLKDQAGWLDRDGKLSLLERCYWIW